MNDFAEAVDMSEEEAVEVATVKTDALLADFEAWIAADMDEDSIVVKLHEEQGLSYPSAVARYRKLKSQAGLTSPRGNKSEEVSAFISEQHEAGVERKDVILALSEKFGYTPNSAASTYSTLGKKLGITGEGAAGNRVPLSDTVAFLRANQDMAKKDLLAKMQEELGYAESTCNAFYIYIPMAKEWAAQETAA